MSDAKVIEQQIRKIEEITKGAEAPSVGQAGLWSVLEVFPDRSQEQSYLLAGSEAMLPNNISLFLALDQLLDAKNDGALDEKKILDVFLKEFLDWQGGSKNDRPWGGVLRRAKFLWIERPQDDKDNPGLKILVFQPDHDWAPTEKYYFLAKNKLAAIWKFLNWFPTFWANQNFILQIQQRQEEGYFKPRRDPGFRLKIFLPAISAPPWNRAEVGPRKVAIPAPKKSAIDYSRLREACGGPSGLAWGQWNARAYLAPEGAAFQGSLKGMSQILAAGDTPEKAEEYAKRFCELSHWKRGGITPTRRDALPSLRVFPGWIELSKDELQGGKIKPIRQNFPIWINDGVPDGWNQATKEFLSDVDN